MVLDLDETLIHATSNFTRAENGRSWCWLIHMIFIIIYINHIKFHLFQNICQYIIIDPKFFLINDSSLSI